MPLREQQWELDGVTFGYGTGIEVREFEVGPPDIETGDLQMPGQDGTVFGRDTHSGRTLTWELFTSRQYAPGPARERWSELQSKWGNPTRRLRARTVMPLRFRLRGDRTVVVYGRPRRFEAPDAGMLRQGHVEFIADFKCADAYFYDDSGEEGGSRSITLTLVASAGSGIVWPVTWPIVWGSQGVRQDTVINRGDSPSWPVITFHGPVANPSIELVGTGRSLRLDTTLAFDRSITIDTRPWARTILRDDGASFAGVARGASLAEFMLPVGQTVLAYRGTDMSGQSRCVVSWRNAYSSP